MPYPRGPSARSPDPPLDGLCPGGTRHRTGESLPPRGLDGREPDGAAACPRGNGGLRRQPGPSVASERVRGAMTGKAVLFGPMAFC